MHHLVFSGPEQSGGAVADALTTAGFPARVDPTCAGFAPEPLTQFVEALDDGLVDPAVSIAARYGYQLRMHGPVDAAPPQPDQLGALEQRIARLESRPWQ